MSNIYGRQVVVPLTNKSGGQVIAGDVVIIDTTNNDGFTTTTLANATTTVGVVQETIASNVVGRVLLSGYAALINVNASVTRGDYGATYSVAKQATDVGAFRAAGTFCQFLTGGTTPDAVVWQPDLGGAVASIVSAHGARATRASTSLSVGNNTYTVIALDAEDYDTDNIHSTSSNTSRLTVPAITGVTTGLWIITASGYFDQTVADFQIRKNAAGSSSGGTALGFNRSNVTTLGAPSLTVHAVLAAADYVELFGRTPGGAGNVAFDAGNSPLFEIAFLGKVS